MVLYGGKLWRYNNLAKLTTDQNSPNFHHPNFYISIIKSHVNVILAPLLKNIEQIEDISLANAQQLAGYHQSSS